MEEDMVPHEGESAQKEGFLYDLEEHSEPLSPHDESPHFRSWKQNNLYGHPCMSKFHHGYQIWDWF